MLNSFVLNSDANRGQWNLNATTVGEITLPIVKWTRTNRTISSLPRSIDVDKLCDFKRVIAQLSPVLSDFISFIAAHVPARWNDLSGSDKIELWVRNGLKFDNWVEQQSPKVIVTNLSAAAIKTYLFCSFAVLSYRLIPLFIECSECSSAIIKWRENCVKTLLSRDFVSIKQVRCAGWRLIDFRGFAVPADSNVASHSQSQDFLGTHSEPRLKLLRLTNSLSLI